MPATLLFFQYPRHGVLFRLLQSIRIEENANIEKNIKRRGNYRRSDMPYIVHKYFDDMHKVIKTVTKSLKPNGRFILVVGDSLIADVYVPTDLILAQIGTELGLSIEKIELARNRYSGQVRNYRLRETIVTLKKELKRGKNNGRKIRVSSRY